MATPAAACCPTSRHPRGLKALLLPKSKLLPPFSGPRLSAPSSLCSPASRMMAGASNNTTSVAAPAGAVAGAGGTAPPPVPRPRQQSVDAENVFEQPGRRFRPEKICIILRGLPGSGKSHVARLLRDLENVSLVCGVIYCGVLCGVKFLRVVWWDVMSCCLV